MIAAAHRRPVVEQRPVPTRNRDGAGTTRSCEGISCQRQMIAGVAIPARRSPRVILLSSFDHDGGGLAIQGGDRSRPSTAKTSWRRSSAGSTSMPAFMAFAPAVAADRAPAAAARPWLRAVHRAGRLALWIDWPADFGSLAAVVVLRGIDQVLRYSIDKPTVELLYLPVPADQTLAREVVHRYGGLASRRRARRCVTILHCRQAAAGWPVVQVTWVSLVLLGGWLVAAYVAQRQYVAEPAGQHPQLPARRRARYDDRPGSQRDGTTGAAAERRGSVERCSTRCGCSAQGAPTRRIRRSAG